MNKPAVTQKAKENCFRLDIPKHVNYLSAIRKFIGDLSYQAGFDSMDKNKIELAVDEACSNVILHSGEIKVNSYEVEVVILKNRIDITISNYGNPYRAPNRNLRDVQKQLTDMRGGGLGLVLIRQIMDKVQYKNSGGKNSLRMVKYRHVINNPVPHLF